MAQGRKYVTPEIAQMLVESLTTPQTANAHERLSDRELQTLTMIASGKRLSDIADELALSPKTVSVYRARVLEKLGPREQLRTHGLRDPQRPGRRRLTPGRVRRPGRAPEAAQGLVALRLASR